MLPSVPRSVLCFFSSAFLCSALCVFSVWEGSLFVLAWFDHLDGFWLWPLPVMSQSFHLYNKLSWVGPVVPGLCLQLGPALFTIASPTCLDTCGCWYSRWHHFETCSLQPQPQLTFSHPNGYFCTYMNKRQSDSGHRERAFLTLKTNNPLPPNSHAARQTRSPPSIHVSIKWAALSADSLAGNLWSTFSFPWCLI